MTESRIQLAGNILGGLVIAYLFYEAFVILFQLSHGFFTWLAS